MLKPAATTTTCLDQLLISAVESVKTYLYSAFGLIVRSDIEFDLISAASGLPDIAIRLGCVAHLLRNATGQGVLYQISPRQFLLSIDRVARYLVSDGNEIVIDPASEADPAAIRLFLFGPAFGALLHQRRVLPVHGSSIVTARGAVIFTGLSGSGKSTLACAFHQKGYPVLADEVSAIQVGASLAVMPENPYLMLWADVLRERGIDRRALRPARPQLEKYLLPLGEGFANKSASLHAIYILDSVNAELSGPITVKGLGKIEALAENIYRPHFVEGMHIRAAQVKNITEVARRTPVRVIKRPRRSLQIAELVDLLERDFGT